MRSKSSAKSKSKGEFIVSAGTDRVPVWALYLVGIPIMLLGMVLLVPSLPLFQNKLQGDFEGAIAGTLISAMLIIAGALALRSARKAKIAHRLEFSAVGVRICYADTSVDFWDYRDVDAISVVTAEQSAGELMLAFLAGGVAGYFGAKHGHGRVRVTFEPRHTVTAYVTRTEDRRWIADCADHRRHGGGDSGEFEVI
ncbi:MAG: hypothetical protein R3C18_17250 [Planctomycetaceae bacterium]